MAQAKSSTIFSFMFKRGDYTFSFSCRRLFITSTKRLAWRFKEALNVIHRTETRDGSEFKLDPGSREAASLSRPLLFEQKFKSKRENSLLTPALPINLSFYPKIAEANYKTSITEVN